MPAFEGAAGIHLFAVWADVFRDGATAGTALLAVTVKEKNEAGTVLRSTVHRFHGKPGDSASLPIGYPDWNEGREYETEVGNGTTTALKADEPVAATASHDACQLYHG